MLKRVLFTATMLVALSFGAAFAACSVTIGSVMSLTGSLGDLGQAISKGYQLGIADLNAAGGINGCTVKSSLLDDQTVPSVGVDAAKRLVDVQHVPVIIGALSSGVSVAILTSVTAPSGVVQISPASTSPQFTALAKAGKTGGYFFRTTPSDTLQGLAMAKVAIDAGYKKVAVLYLNNAYGTGLNKTFTKDFTALGGTITQSVKYDPKQPTYQSEVTKALSPTPDALFLIGYPGDGTTVAREWVESGGVQNWLLPDGLESQDFVNDVGAQYFKEVHGTAAGSTETPSLATFNAEYAKKFGEKPTQAYITNAYDATVIAGLAMQLAGTNTNSAAIRDAIRDVTYPNSQKVYAGVAQIKKALEITKEGRPVQYVGASGPLVFNQYGDVSAAFAIWSVKNGKVVQTRTMTAAEIAKVAAAVQIASGQ